jgi:molybdenum cofactor synthesis domain-containing protein
MSQSSALTAAVLLIGNELLSGKTQDANLRYLGTELAKLGIKLAEARVVRDEPPAIIDHLNALRAAHTYVFTTGGIGPTHDDITAECVARAFGTTLEVNADAVAALERTSKDLNEARLKMARIPVGATLVANSVSNAPGFRIENVFVLAGIPSIARAMFEAAKPELEAGAVIRSASVDVFAREGDIAAPLERLALENADVEIGSYPFIRDGRYGANLVVRGTDEGRIEAVMEEIVATMRALGGNPERQG